MFSLGWLLGKEDRFFELLEASAEQSRASVEALACFLKDQEHLGGLDEFVRSRKAEKQIYNEISEALSKATVTHLEREDIEALSLSLYKVPKTVEKVAERILVSPKLLQGFDFTRQITMLEQATSTLVKMTAELRRGVNMERTKAHNDELQKIEGDADKLMLENFRRLYSGNCNPLAVVFLKDLFELLERVFDRCRDAGNVISQIVLKNS